MTDYGTVSGFKTYHTTRGRADAIVEYDDDEIEAAKLVSSEWLDSKYRALFPGLKVGYRAQVREWPRQGGTDIYGYAIPSATVPDEINNATYEATLRELRLPGGLSKDYTPGKYKRVSIDGAVSAEYITGASASDFQAQIAVIDEILSTILSEAGSYSPLSGRVSRG